MMKNTVIKPMRLNFTEILPNYDYDDPDWNKSVKSNIDYSKYDICKNKAKGYLNARYKNTVVRSK